MGLVSEYFEVAKTNTPTTILGLKQLRVIISVSKPKIIVVEW